MSGSILEIPQRAGKRSSHFQSQRVNSGMPREQGCEKAEEGNAIVFDRIKKVHPSLISSVVRARHY